MLIRTTLVLLAATLLSGCVVSFAPDSAVAPTAQALAIQAQRQAGLLALGIQPAEPSAAVELAGVVAAR
jgi:PBP1b-binding outer membrane lipoprotein LpoB